MTHTRCYRVFLNGRSADFHHVILGIESLSGTVVIEREDADIPAEDTPVRPRRIEAFLPKIDGLYRLPEHTCVLPVDYAGPAQALLNAGAPTTFRR